MKASARPLRRAPLFIASAALINQTAAPTYQIQLKFRFTFLWDASLERDADSSLPYYFRCAIFCLRDKVRPRPANLSGTFRRTT